MTLANYLTHAVSSLFQHAELLLICLFLMQTDKKTILRPATLLIYIVSWPLLFAVQMNNNDWVLLSTLPFFLIYTLVIYGVTRRPILRVVLCCLYGYFIMMLTDLPGLFIMLLTLPSESIVNEGWVSLVVALFSSVFAFLILKYLPARKLFNWLCKIPIVIGYFFLIALVFLALLCDLHNNFTYIPPALPYILIIAFVFSSVIFLIYQILSNQKNVAALHNYQQYLPILDNLIQKVRDTQHSHNNMVQSLVHLTELETKDEQLRTQLTGYVQNIQQAVLPSSLLSLENKLLAALLYYKYCQAESSDIHMDFTITDPMCQSHATEFELVDAIGILLDNALENSNAGDTIYVHIGAKEDHGSSRIDISVENPGPIADNAFLHNIFSKGYTTKNSDSESHGIGLNILRNIVKKHRGKLIVSNTEGSDHVRYIVFELVL